MRAILGIGNVGSKYENTRHNIGFMLLDFFAEKKSLSFFPSKNDYYYAKGKSNDFPFLLIKPSTYVNNSGIAAADVLDQYQISTEDLLILVDDINLPLSEVRLRASGGDGGHNGLASIIYHLNSNQFPRLRIGIGQEFQKGEMSGYVLSEFNPEEKEQIKSTFNKILILLEEFVLGGAKRMLDANSRLIKSGSNKNISN